LDREEVKKWAIDYIKRPGEFPRLIEAGLIEATEQERKESLQAYVRYCIAQSTTGRIKQQIAERKANEQ
jgi:glycine cleavage system protein P-like pyridoxal-binding family